MLVTVSDLATSSAERMASLPAVPTVAEQGFPGFERFEATNLWAPSGTPTAAIAQLHEAAVAALAEPEVRARLDILGMTPIGSSPAELGRFMAEYRAWAAEMISIEGIRLE